MPMQSPPPVAYAAVGDPNVDASHLTVLAICHYVWGGLLAVFGCFGFIYILLGVLAMTGQMSTSTYSTPLPPTTGPALLPIVAPASQNADALVGTLFLGMGAFIVIGGWTLALCAILAGRSLSKRRRRAFLFTIAIINCLMFPIGTVLGVFTLIVLVRESVRQAFEYETHARLAKAS